MTSLSQVIDDGLSAECREQSAPCLDCGIETKGVSPWEFYMVHQELWAKTGLPRVGENYLCIGCLEQRIGRTLVPNDFKQPAAINHPDGPWHSPRLASRLKEG